MTKKIRFSKNSLFLSLLTFLTILTIAAFAVYKAATQTSITGNLKELITPLDPELNLKELEKIEQQIQF